MAAPVPVALIPLYSSFRIIILNLKNEMDIENSLKKLVLLKFNVTMSNDFDLKNILKRTPVDEDLEELKNMVIAKVEKLESRNAEAKDMEVETPKDEDSGSSSDDETSDEEISKDTDSDFSSDDEESPSKKPCTTSGPIKPTAQRAFCEGLAASETALMLPKLTIKVPNPFAKKSTQPLVPVFGKPQKASPPSATGETIDEYLEKRRLERNEEKKHTAKVFNDPCMKRPKYKIPRKPVSFQPTNSAKAHGEKPNWPPFEQLKDRVLAKIERLEAAYEQKTEIAEEKVNPEALKTSRFEKKPRKRPAESHGSMEPPVKRTMGSKDSSRKSDNWIPKKRLAPSRPSQVAQPQKTASTPPPAAPIITSSSCIGFRIPKKKIAPSSAPEAVMIQSTEPAKDATKPLPPTVSVPVPLLSLVFEKPTWLSEQVLRRY